MTILSNPPLLT